MCAGRNTEHHAGVVSCTGPVEAQLLGPGASCKPAVGARSAPRFRRDIALIVARLTQVIPPTTPGARERLFSTPFSQLAAAPAGPDAEVPQQPQQDDTRTPRSTHGGATPAPPAKSASKGWKPVGGEPKVQPLDLS